MILYSPAMWAWVQQSQGGAKRADGSTCMEKAEPNGWCEACWAEVGPVG